MCPFKVARIDSVVSLMRALMPPHFSHARALPRSRAFFPFSRARSAHMMLRLLRLHNPTSRAALPHSQLEPSLARLAAAEPVPGGPGGAPRWGCVACGRGRRSLARHARQQQQVAAPLAHGPSHRGPGLPPTRLAVLPALVRTRPHPPLTRSASLFWRCCQRCYAGFTYLCTLRTAARQLALASCRAAARGGLVGRTT